MDLITINKNGKELSVTKGAYNSIFKKQGWLAGKYVEPEEEPEYEEDEYESEDEYTSGEENDSEEEDDDEDSENEIEQLLLKPVSEMNTKEIIIMAEHFGINRKGKKKEEVKELLLKEMKK